MTKTVSIPYFPLGLRYTATALLAGALWLVYSGFYAWAALVVVVWIFVYTAKYVTTIDLTKKEFIDAFSFYGIETGEEKQKFEVINKIVITKGRYSQAKNTQGSSRQLDWEDYSGTMIYDEDRSLDLLTREDKRELLIIMRDYATFLKVNIEDRTTGQPYLVDFSKI